jgi:hypothetical protein
MRHDPQSPHFNHMMGVWIGALENSIRQVKRFVISKENTPLDEMKREFKQCVDLLLVGWKMITEHDARPEDGNTVADQNANSSCWWGNWKRFEKFAELATELVARSRQRHYGIYKNANLNLIQCLDHVAKAVPPSKRKQIHNPKGWETMVIAPQLFAKSLCILIGADHQLLGTKNKANLSFLLSHLETTLKLDTAGTKS